MGEEVELLLLEVWEVLEVDREDSWSIPAAWAAVRRPCSIWLREKISAIVRELGTNCRVFGRPSTGRVEMWDQFLWSWESWKASTRPSAP